jgi:hypothetical protein
MPTIRALRCNGLRSLIHHGSPITPLLFQYSNKRGQEISLLSQPRLIFLDFPASYDMDEWYLADDSARTDDPNSESAEAHSLLKQFANIFRESDLRVMALAGRRDARCGCTVGWGRQEAMHFTGLGVEGKTDELSDRDTVPP